MARKGGGGTATPTKKKRKGTAYTEPALLDLFKPGARLLLANEIPYILGVGSRSRFINAETFDDLRANGYITHPERVGEDLAQCVLTESGKCVARQLIDSGFDQINFEEVFEEFQGLEKKEKSKTPEVLRIF